MEKIKITHPAPMEVPSLDEFEIDDIRTTLSDYKEECCDGTDWAEEPCTDKDIFRWTAEDHERHGRWSAETWGKFDNLPLSRLGEETGKLGEIVSAIMRTVPEPKIGHVYEVLDCMEA